MPGNYFPNVTLANGSIIPDYATVDATLPEFLNRGTNNGTLMTLQAGAFGVCRSSCLAGWGKTRMVPSLVAP